MAAAEAHSSEDNLIQLDCANTLRCADAVETLGYRLASGEPQHVVAVAGYELDKETNTRLGSLQAFSVSFTGKDTSKASLVELANEKGLSGILDAKWSPHSRRTSESHSVLACANANGSVSLVSLCNNDTAGDGTALSMQWSTLCSLQFGEEGSRPIVLSADWAMLPAEATDGVPCQLAVSRRDGLLSILDTEINDAGNTASLTDAESWLAHRYSPACGAEAWIVCANPHSSPGTCQELFSGGDDCTMHGWDTRTPIRGPKRIRKPTSSVVMEAGVCSLQWHPVNPFVFASGGYDGAVRVWDTRRACNAVEEAVAETDAGGGVWRLKWRVTHGGDVTAGIHDAASPATDHSVTEDRHLLLGACMRGGAQVYHITGIGAADGKVGITRLAKSLAHGAEALTYGADWIELGMPGIDAMAVTCSFYNSQARLWALPTQEPGPVGH